MRILTDEQVARMEESLLKVTANIRYCSATQGESDYKYIGNCWVHRRELQEIPYREELKGEFEVLYKGKFRTAIKTDFITDK